MRGSHGRGDQKEAAATVAGRERRGKKGRGGERRGEKGREGASDSKLSYERASSSVRTVPLLERQTRHSVVSSADRSEKESLQLML